MPQGVGVIGFDRRPAHTNDARAGFADAEAGGFLDHDVNLNGRGGKGRGRREGTEGEREGRGREMRSLMRTEQNNFHSCRAHHNQISQLVLSSSSPPSPPPLPLVSPLVPL